MRPLLSILVSAAALVLLGTTLAGTSETDPAATAPPTTEGTPSVPAVLTLTLSDGDVAYAERLEARGSLQPMSPGEEVVLEIDTGAGVWSPMTQAPIDGFGAYTLAFDALVAGTLRARATLSGAVSEPVPLSVTPVVRVTSKPGIAFRTATLTATISPSSYSGPVTGVVRRDGERVGRIKGRARHGRLRLEVPTPGVGAFWVELRFAAAGGFAERTVGAKVVAKGRVLSVGSDGRDVVALRARLAELRFYVPGPSTTFSSELFDSVIAFQKTHGLERTGVVDAATWRTLGKAAAPKPRYKGPSPHIEVDKSRQILLVVERGRVVRVLPVSSGATGNTPEGRHQIRWKAPATTTWLGSGILYRTLTFVGNSFAIHGWYSVPPYPASHGCVRIPIFMADWLYNRTPVGETVYVY
jgi:L,D-transpeptidase catalytic domain/Putative peptidoglycan binding domain